MKIHLPDVPILRTQKVVLAAECFNRARLVLARQKSRALRLVLGSHGLEILLAEQAWVCLDRNMNDLPLVAWTDFANGRRSNLNEPVSCAAVLYHSYGGVVMRSAIPILERRLGDLHARLAPVSGPARILSFRINK